MSDLAALQARFQAGILAPDNGAALADINDSPREAAPVLFGVYRHAYAARLVEVLQGNFDKTWSLLGDDGFAEAARAYIAAAPSRFRNARWFGDGFAAFLAGYHAASPAVGDVAALDWAIAGAFDAADEACVRAEALAALHPEDWPGLSFRLQAAVRLVPVTTPAAAIYEAMGAGEAPPALDPVGPQTVLVWRDGLTVRYRVLEPDEAAALAAVAEGQPFAGVCERIAAVAGAETAGARAAQLLGQWLESRLVAAFAVDA